MNNPLKLHFFTESEHLKEDRTKGKANGKSTQTTILDAVTHSIELKVGQPADSILGHLAATSQPAISHETIIRLNRGSVLVESAASLERE